MSLYGRRVGDAAIDEAGVGKFAGTALQGFADAEEVADFEWWHGFCSCCYLDFMEVGVPGMFGAIHLRQP